MRPNFCRKKSKYDIYFDIKSAVFSKFLQRKKDKLPYKKILHATGCPDCMQQCVQ